MLKTNEIYTGLWFDASLGKTFSRPHLNKQGKHGGTYLWIPAMQEAEVKRSWFEAGPGQKCENLPEK
jgi:hypothetical protein